MVRQGFMVERGLNYEEAFGFAAANGFDFVELNMDYTFERQRITAEAVRAAATEHHLALVVHLPYKLDPGSPHEYVRDGACRELEASIDIAAEFGAEKVVFHAVSEASPAKWEIQTIRDYIYDSIRRLESYANKRGLTACVENHRTEFFDASDFPELFTRTDAAACLDTGHGSITGQDLATQAALIREHGDRISHIHLNDSRWDQTDEHLPVGFGKLDFDLLATALRDTGWTGTCTHEMTLFNLEYVSKSKDIFDQLL